MMPWVVAKLWDEMKKSKKKSLKQKIFKQKYTTKLQLK